MSILFPQLLFSAKLTAPPPKQQSEREQKYLRLDDVEGMIQTAQKIGRNGVRDAAIILMMFSHGLRTAELVALKWSQVDFKGGYIEIHRVKNGNDSIHPLRSPELKALCQLQQDNPETEYVFVTERKKPLSTRLVRHLVARAGKQAGIPFPVHPYQLRHTCGYYLASQGYDIRAVQDYLGYKNIHHTVRYIQMSPQRFQNFWSD